MGKGQIPEAVRIYHQAKEAGQFLIAGTVPYTPHPGQRVFHESAARIRVLACGARWGKDRSCVNEAIRVAAAAMQLPGRELLVPKVHVWFVAPNYPLAKQLWRELKAFTPPEVILGAPNETERTIHWRGDVLMEVKSADDPRSLLAVGLDLVVVIEAALLRPEAWEMALYPRLTSPGRLGLAILNGTPKGRNWYWRLFHRGQDPNDPEVESWNFPTRAIPTPDGGWEDHPYGNPHISLDEIENARKEMPDRWFRQEFLAEFLTEGGAVFRNVRQRVSLPPPNPRRPIVVGVDLAKTEDYTVFVAMDADGRMVAMERMQRIPYDIQAERLCEFVKRVGAPRVYIEKNGPGETFIDMAEGVFGRNAVNCSLIGQATSAQSKRQMIGSLIVGFEQGDSGLTILDDPVLLNELEAFSAEQLPSGNERYSAPQGFHDDCVMALAFAWSAVRDSGRFVQRVGTVPKRGANVFVGLKKLPYTGGTGRGPGAYRFRPLRRRFANHAR